MCSDGFIPEKIYILNVNADWYHLVLVTIRPHVISQKVLRVEHCFKIIQNAHGLSLIKDAENSALLPILFEIYHKEDRILATLHTNS